MMCGGVTNFKACEECNARPVFAAPVQNNFYRVQEPEIIDQQSVYDAQQNKYLYEPTFADRFLKFSFGIMIFAAGLITLAFTGFMCACIAVIIKEIIKHV
jgi:hypothetical protein